MAKKEIRVKVVLTKAGDTWDSTKTYALLDYITLADGVVYVSKKTANTGHALTETEWWDKTIDLSQYIQDIQQATQDANTATAGASKVNAVLADNVITVTDRAGKASSVDVGAAADVARMKKSLGPYTDRADVTLTATETGKAISKDGVKVDKAGWAISEFTAELGNEYLFKPGETDGNVCVFAEYIDKVETRGIDYAYTYDSKGRTATATATYGGVTHSYTFAYTDATQDGGTDTVVITDSLTGKPVEYLPIVYKTTVGTYQPLTLLNANAELPADGYCRFVSNFQARASIKVVVSYKVASADLVMKVVRDGMTASMCTQLSRVNQKVDETKAAVDELKSTAQLSGATLVGFQRPNGDPSPDAQKTYGTKEDFKEIAKHLRMAVIKDGKARYLAPGRITMDEDGKTVAIDGSEGDILCATDRDLHMMRATKSVAGVEQNVIGMSLGACSWNGVPSRKIPKFGMVPGYTVNAQIDGDSRRQAHSIYNKSVKGSYSTPTDVFTVSAMDGGGMPNWAVSGLVSIQMAQNKNDDELTARPYLGLHPDMYGSWIAMMYAEMGTLNVNAIDKMGYGNTYVVCDASSFYDTGISGISCMKTIPADGAEGYHYLMGQNIQKTDGTDVYNLSGLNNNYYVFTEMLEPQRVMDAITRDGLTDKVGDPNTFFYFGEDGSMRTIEKSETFDVTTGAGMAIATRYYQVRNVPGCEGLADGVMTGVVNSYMRMDCKDGVTRNDGVSMTGGKVIYKFSHPVYRGMSLPLDGMFRQLGYMYYLKYGHGDNNTMERVLYTTENIEDVKALTSFGVDAYSGDTDAHLHVLDGLDVKGSNLPDTSYYPKRVNYSQSLFSAQETGGGLKTYECFYLWSNRCWGGISTNGYIQEGKKQVAASVVGCCAYSDIPSVRTLYAYYGLGNGSSYYAGAFAVLL